MTNTLAKQRRRFILISLAIPVALLVAFVVVPAADLIRMSFTNWDGLSIKSDFVGLDNYISMFHNADLWQSLKNNAVYFFCPSVYDSDRAGFCRTAHFQAAGG